MLPLFIKRWVLHHLSGRLELSEVQSIGGECVTFFETSNQSLIFIHKTKRFYGIKTSCLPKQMSNAMFLGTLLNPDLVPPSVSHKILEGLYEIKTPEQFERLQRRTGRALKIAHIPLSSWESITTF